MRFAVFAAAALCITSLAARADVISNFQVNGTFNSGSILSGYVTIDTTVGSVTGVNLNVTAPESTTFTSVVQQIPGYGGQADYLIQATGGNESLYLVFDNPTLVGYTGGILGADSNSNSAYSFSSDIAINGAFFEDLNVGQVNAVTPEPSSLALLSTGLVCVFGGVKRRLKQGR